MEDETSGFLFVNEDPTQRLGWGRTGLAAINVTNVTLRYGSSVGGRQQDTLLFVDDPFQAWEDAVDASLPALTARGVGVSWARGLCQRGGVPTTACPDRRYVSVEFTAGDFCVPGTDAKFCPILARARAYTTHDRGACSKRVDAGEILKKLVDQVTKEMYDQVEEGDPGLASTESDQHAGAQTAVWQDAGTLAAVGGFQLNLALDVGTTGWTWDPPGYINYYASGNVAGRYQWVLQSGQSEKFGAYQGVLGVKLLNTHVLGQYDDGDWWFWGFDKPIAGDLADALGDEIPAAIVGEGLARQIVEIPGLDEKPVACTSAAACANPKTSSASGALLIAIEAANLISEDEEDDLKEVVKDPAEWICDKTCKMQLRGQRVNVYPDSVELVFREAGGFPITRESALEMALRKLGDEAKMCDSPTRGQKLNRRFQRRTRDRIYD